MQTKPRRKPPRHETLATSNEAISASQRTGMPGTAAAGVVTPSQTPAHPWSVDYGDRDIGSGSVPLDSSGSLPLLDDPRPEVAELAEGSAKEQRRSSRMTKPEVVGLAMTVAGVLLAMFLVYLYVFSALTGARNQNQLLHSLTGNPKAIFSLASGHEPPSGQPVAILEIPSIGLHQAVVEGTTAADLQRGPGLVASSGISGLPGEPGDAVIAGRRISFGGPFGRLGELHPGSIIQVADGAGVFKFEVTKLETISQGQV